LSLHQPTTERSRHALLSTPSFRHFDSQHLCPAAFGGINSAKTSSRHVSRSGREAIFDTGEARACTKARAYTKAQASTYLKVTGVFLEKLQQPHQLGCWALFDSKMKV